MNYDPQGIFKQGREINLGAQERGCKAQSEKGKRGAYGKGYKRESAFFKTITNSAPSTWWVWVMAEYRGDLKSFTDWSELTRYLDYEAERRTCNHCGSKYPKRVGEDESKYCSLECYSRAITKYDGDYKKRKVASQMTYRRSSPQRRVLHSLRGRLRGIMQTVKRKKGTTTLSLIGCSASQLAKHLESTFKRGMTWDNYGTYWHVDHIIPCAAFDHTDPKQVAQCWHWTNLMALEASKNIAKGGKITKPQMSLMLCAH